MKTSTIDLQYQGHEHTIASFLIETNEGPALVETGPHSTLPQLEQSLALFGYQLPDIQHVFLSHIHLDHAGCAWAFAAQGATIYVHPAGARHLQDPSRLMASAKMIYKDKMDELWGEMRSIPTESIRPVQHGEAFSIGEAIFTAWHTPGHAVHHVAWQLGDTLFTGDVGGVKIGRGALVPPCPPPDINIEDWQQSIALIRTLPVKRLLLTHFGAITEIDQHLTTLEKTLLDWAEWIRPHAEAGRSPEEVLPEFEAFVRKRLLADGLDEEELLQYENANPSWMSVYGLMRYWKKKME